MKARRCHDATLHTVSTAHRESLSIALGGEGECSIDLNLFCSFPLHLYPFRYRNKTICNTGGCCDSLLSRSPNLVHPSPVTLKGCQNFTSYSVVIVSRVEWSILDVDHLLRFVLSIIIYRAVRWDESGWPFWTLQVVSEERALHWQVWGKVFTFVLAVC